MQMPNDNLSELPENWTEAFDEDARDFLYEESRQRLRETIEFGNQQEAKVFALLQISLVIIAASGIFGDLHVELASPAEWNWVVWASILALACWVGVAGLAFTLLNPQSWETGTNVGWLARWSGAGRRDMADAALETLVEGFQANSEINRKRGERLVWLVGALAAQTFFVVLVQVAAAVDTAAAASLFALNEAGG